MIQSETPSLADVALAFCRECLGWEDAKHVYGSDWDVPPTHDYVGSDVRKKRLYYTELDLVMAAVKSLIEGDGQAYLHVGYWGYDSKWGVKIVIANGPPGEAKNADLRHAILEACLKARRNVSGAT